jgi:ATP-dependent DNA helicase RecQ
MQWTPQQVKATLKELERQGVLVYRVRRDGPTVTLLAPRRDPSRLMLTPEALRDREQRAQRRLDAMLHYLSGEVRCREREILSYFGEKASADCGRCDACRARERRKDAAAGPGALSDPAGSTAEEVRWAMEEGSSTGDAR